MPDPIARTYLSLAAFYASDPARRASRERDMGLFWRSRNGPSFRAAWVRDTRELYLFEGWDEICGQRGSLEWLLARIQDPGDPAPKHRFRRDRRGGIVSLGGPAPSAA